MPPMDLESTDVETLELLAALIRLTKPSVVVEAGTYLGHGAIYMADACKANGKGHVYTADPFARDAMRAMFAANGLEDWITLYQTGYLKMLDMPVVDFAFIDASGPGHDASLRWKHVEATLPRLSQGGVMCVHDTAADDWNDGEGGESVRRIRALCDLTIYNNRGISIMVKR